MIREALKITGKILGSGVLLLGHLTRYGVVAGLLLIGFSYTVTILMNLTQDTTTITNSAFAIFATVAVLSFSWARSLGDSSDLKDRIAYAGERFLHGAISVLTGSILKYFAISMGIVGKGLSSYTLTGALNFLVGIGVSTMFFTALLFAHTGLVVLSRLLWVRAYRYPEYDSFF